MDSVLAQIPGLAGYLAQRDFNDQASMRNMQEANTGLSVLGQIQSQHQAELLRQAAASSGGDIEKMVQSAIASGNVDAAAKLKPLLELQRQKALTDQLNIGGLQSLTPDKLDVLAQNMAAQGHPGAAAVAAIADKRRAQAAATDQLGMIRSQPQGLQTGQQVNVNGKQLQVEGDIPPEDMQAALKVASGQAGTATPQPGDQSPIKGAGMFSVLSKSEYPAIASRAQFLQSMVDSPNFRATPEQMAKLQQYAEELSKQQDQLTQQKALAGQRDSRAAAGQALQEKIAFARFGINQDGSLSPDSEQMAQGIASGKLPPLSGFSLRDPGGRAVMARVMQINPNYSAQDYTISLGTEKKFASGKGADKITSFSVGLQHLDMLGEAANALANGDFQGFNSIKNNIAKWSGDTAPTDFASIKRIVGDEIVKAIVGSGGGVHDREEAAATISASNSPQQLMSAIEKYKGLMVGQLNGQYQQYKAGGGKKDFNSFLTEQAQQTAADHGSNFGGGNSAVDEALKRYKKP